MLDLMGFDRVREGPGGRDSVSTVSISSSPIYFTLKMFLPASGMRKGRGFFGIELIFAKLQKLRRIVKHRILKNSIKKSQTQFKTGKINQILKS